MHLLNMTNSTQIHKFDNQIHEFDKKLKIEEIFTFQARVFKFVIYVSCNKLVQNYSNLQNYTLAEKFWDIVCEYFFEQDKDIIKY